MAEEKKTYVYLVTGVSESSDHYSLVMSKNPTKKQLSTIAHGWDGDDYRDGGGYDGSYVEIEVHKLELLSDI